MQNSLYFENLIYFFFCCLCFWCHVQESLAQSNVTRLPPSFSSVGFMVLALMFRSSVHFELILVCGTKVQLHYFAHRCLVYSTLFFEEALIPDSVFMALMSNIGLSYKHGLISGVSILFH